MQSFNYFFIVIVQARVIPWTSHRAFVNNEYAMKEIKCQDPVKKEDNKHEHMYVPYKDLSLVKIYLRPSKWTTKLDKLSVIPDH